MLVLGIRRSGRRFLALCLKLIITRLLVKILLVAVLLQHVRILSWPRGTVNSTSGAAQRQRTHIVSVINERAVRLRFGGVPIRLVRIAFLCLRSIPGLKRFTTGGAACSWRSSGLAAPLSTAWRQRKLADVPVAGACERALLEQPALRAQLDACALPQPSAAGSACRRGAPRAPSRPMHHCLGRRQTDVAPDPHHRRRRLARTMGRA